MVLRLAFVVDKSSFIFQLASYYNPLELHGQPSLSELCFQCHIFISCILFEKFNINWFFILMWLRYEDDSIIGHRLYREVRKVEVKKGKGKNVPPIPPSSYQWEAVATNLDEFLSVSVSLLHTSYRLAFSCGNS